jgi:DNA-binding transcriptional MerR regulator
VTSPVVPEEAWTVDELAQMAGTSVRNLRAFQDRGVIPPPVKQGRSAFYGAAHLYRLRLVLRLQERGYSLASIQELIAAAESGRNVRDLIGLDEAITAPLGHPPLDATPGTVTRGQLMRMFGLKSLPRHLLERAVQLQYLEPEGARFRVADVLMLEAAAGLVRSGIGLPDLLDVAEQLQTHMQRTADDLLWRLARAIDSYGTQIPPAEDVARIAEVILKLRRLVDTVVLAEAHRAIEQAVTQLYTDRLARTINTVSTDRKN